jgi:sulfopyruvate decarboxylase TPP-binding subunit
MVGGEWVLRDGLVTRVDEEAILAEARDLGEAVLRRHDEAFGIGAQILASLRGGWLEALRSDVGVGRSVPLDRR